MPSLLLPLAILSLLHAANAQTANFQTIVKTHGIIGCIAWVIFFPLGAIAIRLLHTPKAWLVHATIQLFAYTMLIVNVGLGIWMGMTTHQLNNYHPIIGLTLFSLISLQPLGGLLHHHLFATHQRSAIIAQTHIWLGRTLITLGMINGGLGMRFGGAVFRNGPTRPEEIAYGVVAGVVWVVWVLVVVFVKVKGKGRKEGGERGAPGEKGGAF